MFYQQLSWLKGNWKLHRVYKLKYYEYNNQNWRIEKYGNRELPKLCGATILLYDPGWSRIFFKSWLISKDKRLNLITTTHQHSFPLQEPPRIHVENRLWKVLVIRLLFSEGGQQAIEHCVAKTELIYPGCHGACPSLATYLGFQI